MHPITKRGLFWTPRILGILFAVFISLFALDVFDMGYNLGETIVALLIHLVPTYILIIALIIAWRREWVGGILFSALAVLYVILSWDQLSVFTQACISGPLFLVGVLFLLNWIYRAQLRTR